MNKEYLTYIIIGIVAVIIITFLINSNQPKQEITSLPDLTLSPSNSETINSINIYNLTNDSILKPQSITPQSITTTLSPTTTLTPTTTTPTTTLRSTTTTTLRSTTTPTTTTLTQAITTSPATTISLRPVTTTLSPAQRTLIDIVNKQKELERKLKEQEDKEKEDLFNIPLIPIFERDYSQSIIPSEGFYQVRVFGGNYYPCYDISQIRNKNDGEVGYMGYINGGDLGSLFDNNDTTGVLFQGNPNNTELYFIVITMPVKKTFKGKLKMNFLYAWPYGLILPIDMTINTADSITNDYFKYRDWQQNLEFIKSFNKVDLNYGSEPKSTNKYLESVSLEIKDNSIPKFWDLDLKKPFNSIIFKFNGRGNPARAWITSISFEKSR